MFFQKFNRKFYLENNPDVKLAGLDPFTHFLEYGKMEGRLPSKKSNLPMINTYRICNKRNFLDLPKIPIVIPTFNNPTYLKNFLAQLKKFPKLDIHIYDNNSTYPPMIHLLDYLSDTFNVKRNKFNRGPEFVYQDELFLKYLPQYFLISDPDLQLNSSMPVDFYNDFYGLTEYFKIGKAGAALNIPSNLKTRQKLTHGDVTTTAVEYEKQFWQNKSGFIKRNRSPVYGASIGATLSLINLNYLTMDNHWKKGIRVAGDYEVKHLPWEMDFDLPQDELKFYNDLQKFSFYTPK